jgi:hypothetical protein
MQSLMRFVFLCYLGYLTALLWTADPSRLIGGRVPGFLQAVMFMSHTLAFGVLAVLALMARWPAPRGLIFVALAAYGGLTEYCQHFFPPRHPRWADWCQDLLGIGIGFVLCWIVAIGVRVVMNGLRGWKRGACPASAQVEALQQAASPSEFVGRLPPR